MEREGIRFLQGTLDLMILKVLESEPMHGFGVGVRIRVISEEALQVEEGSLYPALYRLEKKGWVQASWGVSENNRRARFYALTQSGRHRLGEEARKWRTLSSAVGSILNIGTGGLPEHLVAETQGEDKLGGARLF